MDTLQVALCEDLPEEQAWIISLLENSVIPVVCTVFADGEALLHAYRPERFDLLLIDIYMRGMTGIEALARIREMDSEIPAAFITTSTEHTLESYRLRALKYIEKPVRLEEIAEILELALMRKKNRPSLVVQKNGKDMRLYLSSVLYLEQQGRQVVIYCKGDAQICIYGKLASLLTQLHEPLFFCSHKSFCVNLSYVRFIDHGLKCFVMENGSNVPITRPRMAGAKQAYENYLYSRTRGIL